MVSVCLITYRHPQFIREAIEGVMMQQTSFPVQLVIGEDCSGDSTREICEGLERKYAGRIRLLPSDRNYGQNNNLYRTLKACTGNYIALFEGDDYWTDPHKLQRQVDFLQAHPECVLCFHGIYSINEYGGILSSDKVHEEVIFYRKEQVFHVFVPTLAMVFRNCLSEFPPEFFQVKSTDTFLVGMLSGHGDTADLGFIGGCYRRHKGGLYNRLSSLGKYKQAIHTRKLMSRSSFFSREQKKEIRRELARRIWLYIKIFLKKRQLLNFIRIALFYLIA